MCTYSTSLSLNLPTYRTVLTQCERLFPDPRAATFRLDKFELASVLLPTALC